VRPGRCCISLNFHSHPVWWPSTSAERGDADLRQFKYGLARSNRAARSSTGAEGATATQQLPHAHGHGLPSRASGVRLFRTFSYRQRQRAWRNRQALDFPTMLGRRNWTRTNDPHHVKVGQVGTAQCSGDRLPCGRTSAFVNSGGREAEPAPNELWESWPAPCVSDDENPRLVAGEAAF
jgi:hypothetical protein